MKLKDYIEQGYTVLTTGWRARRIKSKYPKAQVVDVEHPKHPVDGISFTKLLVDWYIKEESYVKHLEPGAKVVTTVSFNKSFCGDLGDCKAHCREVKEVLNVSKENEELLNMGMGILKHADASKLESVNVDVTKRPDGSKRIAIELVYPEEADNKDYHIHTGKITGATPAQWGRILGY